MRKLNNFIYQDSVFCETIEDLVKHEDVSSLPEDWEDYVELTREEKVVKLDKYFFEDLEDWFLEYFEFRVPPWNEKTRKEIWKVFRSNIDKKKIEEEMPSSYYGTDKHVLITKKDLLK